MKPHQYQRLSDLLAHIDQHLEVELNLENLAERTAWSRWQLQRVFQLAYDCSLMAYVKQRRLAKAAEALLATTETINEIAFAVGFESQAVFSRVFKSHFSLTPKQYRQRGQLVNVMPKFLPPLLNPAQSPLEVRLQVRPAFFLYGFHTRFNSIYSENANNFEVLGELWRKLYQYCLAQPQQPEQLAGLVDISTAINDLNDGITYWAGIASDVEQDLPDLEQRLVPAQNYAVFEHRGPLANLKTTLLMYLLEWLPNSGYKSADAVDLEFYPFTKLVETEEESFRMELWMPIDLG